MVIVYKGKGISLNESYTDSWKTRYRKIEMLKAEMLRQLAKVSDDDTFFKSFNLTLLYNGNQDIDNTAPTIKVFVDSMRKASLIANDTSNYFKKLTIEYDPTLPTDTFEFHVEEIF